MDKFDPSGDLFKCYRELEKEFTRKSQQVKEYKRMEDIKDLRVYAKALDIMAFNLVCTIAGLKTKEEKREKKEEFKKLALEVAEFLVDENNELMEVK